ncbi:hypothetical protein VNO80_03049 [Phaseolus coccineus]|uniref:Uncharacterized protein n=1 Tax=Phaseolus coccineus TaxID=3886 RepID=A0AAN9NSG6_PHACN
MVSNSVKEVNLIDIGPLKAQWKERSVLSIFMGKKQSNRGLVEAHCPCETSNENAIGNPIAQSRGAGVGCENDFATTERHGEVREKKEGRQVLGKMKCLSRLGTCGDEGSKETTPSARRTPAKRRPTLALTVSPLHIPVKGNRYSLHSRARKVDVLCSNGSEMVEKVNGGATQEMDDDGAGGRRQQCGAGG